MNTVNNYISWVQSTPGSHIIWTVINFKVGCSRPSEKGPGFLPAILTLSDHRARCPTAHKNSWNDPLSPAKATSIHDLSHVPKSLADQPHRLALFFCLIPSPDVQGLILLDGCEVVNPPFRRAEGMTANVAVSLLHLWIDKRPRSNHLLWLSDAPWFPFLTLLMLNEFDSNKTAVWQHLLGRSKTSCYRIILINSRVRSRA